MATADLYTSFFESALGGAIDITSTGTVKCALFDDTFTFDPTHSVFADLTGEITDTDYSQQNLSNIILTLNASSLPYELNYDCDNISFGTSVSISAYHAVIYDSANDALLFHVDFEGLQESVDGTFELQIDSNGLFDIITDTA